MTEAYVSTPSGRLAVRDHGGDGPEVLLLHGAGQNLEVWRTVIDALGGRARVVSADLRGHGWSRFDGRFTLADLAADVTSICTATNLDHPVLVGHSLGGWVAMAAAAGGSGVRSLVTIEGPVISMTTLFRGLGLVPDGGEGGADALRATAFRGDEAAWTKRLMQSGPPRSVARAIALRNQLREVDGFISACPTPDVLMAAQRCTWQIDPLIAYRQAGVPVTVVLGTRQAFVADPKRFNDLRLAAVASLTEIDHLDVQWTSGGHHLPTERPDAVADAILAATFH